MESCRGERDVVSDVVDELIAIKPAGILSPCRFEIGLGVVCGNIFGDDAGGFWAACESG